MNLKERIQELCKRTGKSMNQVEIELGFGKGYLSKLGKSIPNVKKLREIASYFNVTVDYLLNGKEDEDNGDSLIQDRDLKKRYLEIYDLLKSGETAPLYFDGQPADPESIDLLLKQVEVSLSLIERSKE